MARHKVKSVPLSSDDKVQVLRKLQGRPHFEKFLTGTSSASVFRSEPRWKTSCRLMVPAWFVHKHGDKFRQLVILRTESSTKAWPVTLEISVFSPVAAAVRFSGGWKAFATSHGLLEGDSLIFALTTAISEFEVYVFRNRDSAANAKAKLDLLHMDLRMAASAKEKTAVNVKEKLNSLQTDLLTKHSTCPTFFKKLTTTNVASGIYSYFEIPSHFMKIFGSRIHSVVKLQGIHEQSPEKSMKCRKINSQQVRYFLKAEWRVFSAENHLRVGQELLFTLAADSFFIVREAALPIPPSIALQKSMQDSCTPSKNSG